MSDNLQDILIQHIEKSNKFQDEAIKKLSAIETHQSYTTEKLSIHESHIEDYKKHKGIIYGSIISLSVILGWISEFWHKLFK